MHPLHTAVQRILIEHRGIHIRDNYTSLFVLKAAHVWRRRSCLTVSALLASFLYFFHLGYIAGPSLTILSNHLHYPFFSKNPVNVPNSSTWPIHSPQPMCETEEGWRTVPICDPSTVPLGILTSCEIRPIGSSGWASSHRRNCVIMRTVTSLRFFPWQEKFTAYLLATLYILGGNKVAE